MRYLLILTCSTLTVLFALFISIPPALAQSSGTTTLTSMQIDRQVAALLKKMTLPEKVGQLVQFAGGDITGPSSAPIDVKKFAARGEVGSILDFTGARDINRLQRIAVEKSRLKIPLLFGLDVIHGYRTVFPIPLGLAASWDPALIQRTARTAAQEATADGIRWTFSPMVDIARDARWGRIMEGAGEDPYLGSAIAAAYVRGYQGDSLSDSTSMLACAKHYVAYGAVEGGREYNSADLSDRLLRDIYLPPFKAAVDAGAGTLMSAFNTIDGVPATADRYTLTDILRNEWGFRGFVVSDYDAIRELEMHGVALDDADATKKALTAGVDMDMQSDLYTADLANLVKRGQVNEKVVDQSVARVLRVKFALGLFAHPYVDESRTAAAMLRPESVVLARDAAEESFVLLKNDSVTSSGAQVLPIGDDATVALIGPLADSQGDMLGGWSGVGGDNGPITLKSALADRLKDRLIYARGTDIETESEAGFSDAISAANRANVVVMALGESRDMSGEASSRADIGLPGNQLKLLQAVVATGKPVVMILFNGRPLALPWAANHVTAILEAWFPGIQAGPALVRTLFGESNPSGKLTASFPRSVGQEPIYYNTLSTGRPIPPGGSDDHYLTGYIDESNTAQYPFGWGLSYTKFSYSPTQILTPRVSVRDLTERNAAITVQATVTNTGTRTGTEIAQLYLNERGVSVARPIRELKGFRRITLAPGQSLTLRFRLAQKEIAFWNVEDRNAVERCELTVWVAPNSTAGVPAKIMIEP